MPVEAAQLIKDDQDHLIHPLHHPSDHLEPMVYVRGRGAVLTDVQGREYIDGLAGLWNVNVGHGRTELADAAANQIRELAYFSAYSGSSNIPAIELASKLMTIAYKNMQGVFFTSGAPSPTSRRSRPRASTGRLGASRTRSRSSRGRWPTMG